MNQNYENLGSNKSSSLQKKRNEHEENIKPSSVKKALNWLFLSEYKE